MSRFKKVYFFIAIIFVYPCLFSCSSSVEKREASQKLSMHFTQQGWKKTATDKADHFYTNQNSGKVLYVSSYCSRYQDNYLETISQSQFGGIKNLTIISKETVMYKKREAVEITARGYVDGIPIHLLSRSVRKDNCLFDFVMISPGAIKNKDKATFSLFLKGSQF